MTILDRLLSVGSTSAEMKGQSDKSALIIVFGMSSVRLAAIRLLLNAKVLPPNTERLNKIEKGQTILVTLPPDLIYWFAHEPKPHHR